MISERERLNKAMVEKFGEDKETIDAVMEMYDSSTWQYKFLATIDKKETVNALYNVYKEKGTCIAYWGNNPKVISQYMTLPEDLLERVDGYIFRNQPEYIDEDIFPLLIAVRKEQSIYTAGLLLSLFGTDKIVTSRMVSRLTKYGYPAHEMLSLACNSEMIDELYEKAEYLAKTDYKDILWTGISSVKELEYLKECYDMNNHNTLGVSYLTKDELVTTYRKYKTLKVARNYIAYVSSPNPISIIDNKFLTKLNGYSKMFDSKEELASSLAKGYKSSIKINKDFNGTKDYLLKEYPFLTGLISDLDDIHKYTIDGLIDNKSDTKEDARQKRLRDKFDSCLEMLVDYVNECEVNPKLTIAQFVRSRCISKTTFTNKIKVIRELSPETEALIKYDKHVKEMVKQRAAVVLKYAKMVSDAMDANDGKLSLYEYYNITKITPSILLNLTRAVMPRSKVYRNLVRFCKTKANCNIYNKGFFYNMTLTIKDHEITRAETQEILRYMGYMRYPLYDDIFREICRRYVNREILLDRVSIDE
jgi:hypothetical protein